MSEINWVHKDSTTIKEVADKETQQRVIENSKDYIIERLQQENKQLKEESPYLYTNTEWEDILEYQGKSYIELDRFKTIQQENKQLKEDLRVSQSNEETYCLEMQEITKILGLDEHTLFDDVKQYVKNQISISNELFSWLCDLIETRYYFDDEYGEQLDEIGNYYNEVWKKIQKLKEKYK